MFSMLDKGINIILHVTVPDLNAEVELFKVICKGSLKIFAFSHIPAIAYGQSAISAVFMEQKVSFQKALL